LTRVAAKYAEQARVSVRNVRRDGVDVLRKLEKDSEISQDEHRKLQNDIQQSDRQSHQSGSTRRWCRRIRKSFSLMSEAAGTPGSMPRHIAIIMDGNGRWAKARGLPRIAGHRRRRRGSAAHGNGRPGIGDPLPDAVRVSSENWKRRWPKSMI